MSGRNARTLTGKSLLSSVALLGALLGFAACSKPNAGSIAVNANELNGGIIGGVDATGTEDYAKSTVMLYDKAIGGTCSASIVSDKLLVTAAHCVRSNPLSLFVVFGTKAESTDIIIRRVVTTETTDVWASRQMMPENNGDMALVGFVGGLPAGYVPARMLGDATKLVTGMAVTLAGYGTSDGVANTGDGILRSVETTILDAKYTETEILMEQSKGKGACHGDSGGPAYVTVDGKRLLIGVTSRGVNDALNHCDVASAYTSIAAYVPWIVRTAKLLTAQVNAFKPPQAAPKPQVPGSPDANTGAPVAKKPVAPVQPNAQAS